MTFWLTILTKNLILSHIASYVATAFSKELNETDKNRTRDTYVN